MPLSESGLEIVDVTTSVVPLVALIVFDVHVVGAVVLLVDQAYFIVLDDAEYAVALGAVIKSLEN